MSTEEWQPIETAPKNEAGEMNGPWILVWCKYDHHVRQARWGVATNGLTLKMGWLDAKDRALAIENPTHWMPLPNPPRQP